MRFNIVLFIGLFIFLLNCGKRENSGLVLNKNREGGIFQQNENGKLVSDYTEREMYKLDTLNYISFQEFESIEKEISDYEGNLNLIITLTDAGASRFEEMTKRNIRKQLCFMVNNIVLVAPMVQSEILDGRISLTLPKNEAEETFAALTN